MASSKITHLDVLFDPLIKTKEQQIQFLIDKNYSSKLFGNTKTQKQENGLDVWKQHNPKQGQILSDLIKIENGVFIRGQIKKHKYKFKLSEDQKIQRRNNMTQNGFEQEIKNCKLCDKPLLFLEKQDDIVQEPVI